MEYLAAIGRYRIDVWWNLFPPWNFRVTINRLASSKLVKFQFSVNYWINKLCFWGWILFSHAFRKDVIWGKNKTCHWWLSSHGATVFKLFVCCLCRLFHPSILPYRAERRPYPVLKIELLRVPIGHSDSIVIRPGGSCLQARPDEGLEQYWTPANSQKALHVNTAQPLYSI